MFSVPVLLTSFDHLSAEAMIAYDADAEVSEYLASGFLPWEGPPWYEAEREEELLEEELRAAQPSRSHCRNRPLSCQVESEMYAFTA